jgi:hypothetical protein
MPEVVNFIFAQYMAHSRGADDGVGVISSAGIPGGVARKNGVPISTRVYLSRHSPGSYWSNFKREYTVSDENGAWQFTGLNVNFLYRVDIIDPDGEAHPAVLDRLTPVVPE